MKIIEYILAFIIIMSFIPMFNTMIHTYYTVKPVYPPGRLQDLIMSQLTLLLRTQYRLGNLTPEYVDLTNFLNQVLGEDILRSYGYYAVVYSSIENITVDYTNRVITIKTLENHSLYTLIFFNDGSTIQINKPYSLESLNGRYTYTIHESELGGKSIDEVEAIVAILESTTSRYAGYWIKKPEWIGYALNINGLKILVNKSLTLNTWNLYGYSVVNTTLVVYNDIDHKYILENYKYFELISRVILNASSLRKEVYLNETHIFYTIEPGSGFNVGEYIAYPVIVYRIDIPVEREYQCYDQDFYYCELVRESETGEEYVTRDTVSYPIYNAVMFVLNSSDTRIYIPVYRQRIVVGSGFIPSVSALTIRSTIRIGMFDYNIILYLWRW
ncbi:MAG: hypothetical protein ABWW65_04220 [Thermoprotei archaeon]